MTPRFVRVARRSGPMLLIIGLLLTACSSAKTARLTPTAATPTGISSSPTLAVTTATRTATVPTVEPTPLPLTATAIIPTDPSPMPDGVPATVVYRGNAAKRMVALTFDAGSDAGYTAQILETLQRENVRASFGMTGLWAEQNHDLLLAIAAQGHEFINHTYHHASFTGLSSGEAPLSTEQRALEISRTEATVYHLTGRTTRPLFRPPFGDLDESVRRDVARDGYSTIVMWTVDTLGWKGASADEIVARSLEKAEPGAIYVMHVGSQSQDGPALTRMIDGLRAAGYSFGTVSELLAS